MSSFVDLVQFATPTTGTGTLTVGAALTGKRTPLQAAVADGTEVSYSILDGLAYEYGRGVVGGSGTTLTRGPLGSSSSNAAIALSGTAKVAFVLLAEDLADLSSPVLTFNTLADFRALPRIPPGVTEVRIRNMAGPWPAIPGQTATPLSFKPAATSSGLYGEVIVAGKLFTPVYSVDPVNAGEFGAVGDAGSSYSAGVGLFTATADGTNVLHAVSNFAAVGVNHRIANISWYTRGAANCVPSDCTITAINSGAGTLTLSGNAPAGTALRFMSCPDIITGTDSTAALQAAIDFALQNRYLDVHIPVGNYRTTDTLQLGWSAFWEINLIGTKKGGNISGGVIILPERIDRPAINIGGCYASTITGITVIGRNRLWVQNAQAGNLEMSPTRADWVAPFLTPTGNNPGGLQPHSPYCGICIDGYAGPQPVDHYPDRTYPSWVPGGPSYAQYNQPPCSDITIEHCEINGFALNICVKPNSDGNADFTKVRNCILQYGAVGFGLFHTQSRNVELRNITHNGFHSGIINCGFGVSQGKLSGPVDNVTFGCCYNLFDVGINATTGPLRVSDIYCESCVRIGTIKGGGTNAPAVVFICGDMSFLEGPYTHNQIPAGIIEGDAGTCIKFIGVKIQGYSRITNLATMGDLYLEEMLFSGNYNSISGSSALVRAGNYSCGGMLLGAGRFNSTVANYQSANHATRVSKLRSSYFPGAGSAYYDEALIYAGARYPVHQAARRYKDSQGREWGITLNSETILDMSNLGNAPIFAMSYAGDILTFQYYTVFQDAPAADLFPYSFQPGDILFHIGTGTIFVCTDIQGPFGSHYNINFQQQNNIRVNNDGTFLSNTNPDPGLSNYCLIIKTGATIPNVLYYGTFTAGSVNITDVNRGDGIGSDLTTYYAVGDLFYGVPYNSGQYATYPITPGTKIASVTNGSPGSLTLTQPALCNGVFPIFPYELTGHAPPVPLQSSFETRTLAMAARIARSINAIQTFGYATCGDGGGASYKRITTPDYPTFSFQSADGAWWQYMPEASGWNVMVAGVVANPSTNDTPNVMNALLPFQSSGSFTGGQDVTGTLVFPPKEMRLDTPVYITGSPGRALELKGQSLGNLGGLVSTAFSWHGTDYPSMFVVQGCFSTKITGINFDGVGAGANLVNIIHLSSDNTFYAPGFVQILLNNNVSPGINQTFTCDHAIDGDGTSGPGLMVGAALGIGYGSPNFELVYVSSVATPSFTATCLKSHSPGEKIGNSGSTHGVHIDECTFAIPIGSQSAGILIGNPLKATCQISELEFNRCNFVGDGRGYVYSGARLTTGGNTKNYRFYYCDFIGLDYPVCGEIVSGNLVISYCTSAGTRLCEILANGASNVMIENYECEGSGMLFKGAGGLGGLGATLTQVSYQCGLPDDQVVIDWAGNLTLINCIFLNGWGDASHASFQKPPKIKVGTLFPNPLNATAGAIFSVGNYYQWGSPDVPIFYDGSGNRVGGLDANRYEFRVVQFNDYGEGGWYPQQIGQLTLTDSIMFGYYFGQIQSFPGGNIKNSIKRSLPAQVAETGHSLSVDYTAINTFNNSYTEVVLWGIPDHTIITGILAEVNIPFKGTGITASTIEVGTLNTSSSTFIKPCDAFTAAKTYGIVEADLGIGLAAATRPSQLGWASQTSWSTNELEYVILRITTVGANINSLGQGKVTIYITTKRFK
jgi:hypothetical protein